MQFWLSMATVDKHMLLEILSWALLLHTLRGVPKDAYKYGVTVSFGHRDIGDVVTIYFVHVYT